MLFRLKFPLTDVIMLYIHIHQGSTISCVMEYDIALNIKFTVIAYTG